MAGNWLGDGGNWSGPRRGNSGSRGDRQAQRRREAAKRRAARAAAREAREAAGKVASKRGPKVKTVWWKRRVIGKQTPPDARAIMTLAKKEVAARVAALELEKEAAVVRLMDALKYADDTWEKTGCRAAPFLA